MAIRIVDVIEALEKRYPSASAELWDSVGLVSGNPNNEVSKVLFTVDPAEDVIQEAIEVKAQLIIAHHPLILGEASSQVINRKSQIMSKLTSHDMALFTAHTNADVAIPGVTDALAKAIGVTSDCAIDQVKNLGRIGNLARALPLSDFANQVADSLIKTKRGIHVAGDLTKAITRVALCAGSGADLLELVGQSDADVYVTSDLKYHVTEEFINAYKIPLIDISHFAAEWTWLDQAAKLLENDLGGTLKTHVSRIVTDPWTQSIF